MLAMAVFFWWMRYTKELYRLYYPSELDTKHEYLITSFIASLICVFLTHPIWFINARTIIDTQNRSLYTLILDIYHTEGFYVFYKGLPFDLIMIVNPVISFFLYETIKH